MSIKELRKASGMTQQAFSDYFGIPKRTIEDWEAGRRKCSKYILDLIEYKLNAEQEKERQAKETEENIKKAMEQLRHLQEHYPQLFSNENIIK